MLNSLPRDIQQQFYIKIYKDKISKIKLFQNPANSEEDVGTFLDDKGIAYFASLFEIESYSPGQFVYKEEYISDNLFFITKGRVRLIEPNNFFKFEVKQGDIFGDLEFFRGFTRLMKAVNPSKILNKNLSLVGSVAEEAVARSKKNWFDTMGGGKGSKNLEVIVVSKKNFSKFFVDTYPALGQVLKKLSENKLFEFQNMVSENM